MSWSPKIGMKVVCVDMRQHPNPWFSGPYPEEGRVYTIEGHAYDDFYDSVMLVFEEIGLPFSYRKSRFRPLLKRKTDIGIFQAMLKDTRESIDA